MLAWTCHIQCNQNDLKIKCHEFYFHVISCEMKPELHIYWRSTTFVNFMTSVELGKCKRRTQLTPLRISVNKMCQHLFCVFLFVVFVENDNCHVQVFMSFHLSVHRLESEFKVVTLNLCKIMFRFGRFIP